MKNVKTCLVTHAITKDSYPTMPHLASPFKVGDKITVKKIRFRNGEHQVCGYLNDTSVVVELSIMWTNLYN